MACTGWELLRDGTVAAGAERIREGDSLTIDGASGVVYAGAVTLASPNPFENERLRLLVNIIDVLASERALPEGFVGSAWRIRDVLFHKVNALDLPDSRDTAHRWPTPGRNTTELLACRHLSPVDVTSLFDELKLYTLVQHRNDYSLLWFGLRQCLQRLLSKYVGIGRHPDFYRPLFDPCEAIRSCETDSARHRKSSSRVQLIGEEFFSINHYAPDYLEFSTIRIYAAVRCQEPADLWRIDRTNPCGEKLLEGSADVLALKVVVNDASVPLSELAPFYTFFRLKERFWKWYRASNTSRQEVKKLLSNLSAPQQNLALRNQLVEAGLLSAGGALTSVGASLLHPSNALARVRQEPRLGW